MHVYCQHNNLWPRPQKACCGQALLLLTSGDKHTCRLRRLPVALKSRGNPVEITRTFFKQPPFIFSLDVPDPDQPCPSPRDQNCCLRYLFPFTLWCKSKWLHFGPALEKLICSISGDDCKQAGFIVCAVLCTELDRTKEMCIHWQQLVTHFWIQI